MSAQPAILIIEDDTAMIGGLQAAFELDGYSVDVETDGAAGLQQALQGKYDVIIMDLMLPAKNGYQICLALREKGIRTPILMLSARHDELSTVTGLDLGADDYMTKPFGLAELTARVKTLQRRATRGQPQLKTDTVTFGSVTVDFTRGEITRDGLTFHPAEKELKLLRLLVRFPNGHLRRQKLLEVLGEEGEHQSARSVDNYIVSLRKLLGDTPGTPRHIVTVHGIGYMFVP